MECRILRKGGKFSKISFVAVYSALAARFKKVEIYAVNFLNILVLKLCKFLKQEEKHVTFLLMNKMRKRGRYTNVTKFGCTSALDI